LGFLSRPHTNGGGGTTDLMPAQVDGAPLEQEIETD